VFIAKSKAQPDAQYTRNEGKREEERGKGRKKEETGRKCVPSSFPWTATDDRSLLSSDETCSAIYQ
jgi:hypothetical protein